MKRFLMSSIAASMALSVIGTTLAMAQPAPEQHGPPAAQSHPSQMPHAAIQHGDSAHGNMPHDMQHETFNHVPVSPDASHMAHAENHAPPMQHEPMQHEPMQHEVMQGGGHQWRSGDHFDGSRHYVSNWQDYHLKRPPGGYQWVQDGSEFVLVAAATGIISEVILNAGDQ